MKKRLFFCFLFLVLMATNGSFMEISGAVEAGGEEASAKAKLWLSQFSINQTPNQTNTSYGKDAGKNSTGEYCSFFGNLAGYLNTGSFNTFIGYRAGENNTGGTSTFLGGAAGRNNSGYFNTFIGNSTGRDSTGGENTFVGYGVGRLNSSGTENTFVGMLAGECNTFGYDNTFIGSEAGGTNEDGYRNTFVGRFAGQKNKNGYRNVFLGYGAGRYELGSHKLYISNGGNPLISGSFNDPFVKINGRLGIGVEPTRYVEVWNGAYCSFDGYWMDASSREYKENIEPLETVEAMDVLEGLEPVTFIFKKDKAKEHVGFIAEDVPELVASKDRKGLSALKLVSVLTKVVQEQQKSINELTEMTLELRARIAELERQNHEK